MSLSTKAYTEEADVSFDNKAYLVKRQRNIAVLRKKIMAAAFVSFSSGSLNLVGSFSHFLSPSLSRVSLYSGSIVVTELELEERERGRREKKRRNNGEKKLEVKKEKKEK